MRRIAVMAPRFAEGATVGGAETLLRCLAGRLARHGYAVDFLTTCAENHFSWENTLPPGRTHRSGLDVIRFPVDEDRDIDRFLRIQQQISHGGTVARDEQQYWMDNNVNSRALYTYLEQEGAHYDLIIAGPYMFGVIWRAAQIHPGKTLLVPCLHNEPFAWLEIMHDLFEQVAGFLFNSLPEQQLAQRIFNIGDRFSRIVGMGLEPFDADPAAFAKRHDIHQPYVLYSGRREPMKGTPMLLDYLAAFRHRTGRDVKLVLTGSGMIEPPADLWPHILDVGIVPEKEKQEAMAGATVFCHPSTHESFGIVLLEAWLGRTPGLVHAKGEVLRYQCRQSGGGLWFRSYPEFEEELKLLLDRLELNRRMGDAGREYVLKMYAWDNVEHRLLDAVNRFC
jgi:glycosyltransferase involved in cell wall biosynthesis